MSFNFAPGYSLGQVVERIDTIHEQLHTPITFQGMWTDDGDSILDYVAAVADFAVAKAAYRAACRRWPKAKITLRQGARVVERNWSTSEAAN